MKANFTQLPSETAGKFNHDDDDTLVSKDQRLSAKKLVRSTSKTWLQCGFFGICLILFSVLSLYYLLKNPFLSSSIPDYFNYTDKFYSDVNSPCDVHSPWSSWSTIFEINARSGNVSFAAVKLIDLAWDLGIGRGGQIMLAWLSYSVFARALMRTTEKHPVSYELFASIALHSSTLRSFFAILPAIIRVRGWQGKSALAWMAIAITYVLAFPTLLSASTSYVSATQTSVNVDDHSLAPIAEVIRNASYLFYNNSDSERMNPFIVRLADLRYSYQSAGGAEGADICGQ